uniref:NADH-ubiquinone oxidoreductase chain 4 n=1 Tax=Lythrypnus sp. AC-2023 TaxID=3028465 RepID=A0AA95Z3N0_9GOBI|nr:NADH dehydrogenase subunit 4 [Lythrypnus sp. AC-2023]
MMKIITTSIMLIPLTWLSPKRDLWRNVFAYSLLLATLTLNCFYYPEYSWWSKNTTSMAIDPLSTPLLVLTCWLLPLMLLASQHHMMKEPLVRQRTFISLLVVLQTFLIAAFSATELILFYVMFEATLIPTLALITRWGNQAQRLNAGLYFLFYTLAGSLPLLVALLLLQKSSGSLSLLYLQDPSLFRPNTNFNKMWWAACLVAFLVKMPLYGVHLWLPKAHVEAPIAGSMILAAILLKLGGYGMIRVMSTLEPLTPQLNYPFMILAMWGVLMTGAICLRQTDLKSLIAYSSVGHMGLVVAGIFTQTAWGVTGALILMVAHGLTSSALFCLANINYERTATRTMMLARGMQLIMPLMAAWWFMGALANMALPPLPNLLGELLIISSLLDWSWMTIMLTGPGTLIAASYSLYMFLMTQRGPLPQHMTSLFPTYSREHLLLTLHFLPLLLLILKPDLIGGCSA